MRDKIEFDVIIVGAGLSGLTAAHTLLEKDPYLNVLLLESSNRVGGRLLSKPLAYKDGSGYSCYDFGGQFIRSTNVYLLELLEDLKLKPAPYQSVAGKHIIEKKDGKVCKTASRNPFKVCGLIDRFQLFRFFLKLEEMCEGASFRNPQKYAYLDEVTLETFMRKWFMSSKARDIFRSMVLATCGVQTTQISALFYLALLNSTRGLEFLRKEDVFFIEGGTEEICYSIVRKLSSAIKTELNATVEEINESDDGIVVETTTNTYHYIIIAIQSCELKNITFNPQLPQEGAVQSISKGSLAKFVVTYKTAFWQEKGFSGKVLSCGDGPIVMCCDVTCKGRPALSGMMHKWGHVKSCFSGFCEWVKSYDFQQEEVLRQLAKYFGKEALEPVDFCAKQWNDTGSPMCCLGLNTMSDYKENFCSENRIFWASAEVTDYFYGHMEGAVESGYKAAVQALYACRPSAINLRNLIRMSERDLKPIFHYRSSFIAYFLKRSVVVTVLVLTACLVLRKLK